MQKEISCMQRETLRSEVVRKEVFHGGNFDEVENGTRKRI